MHKTTTKDGARTVNAMSVDVEDYYQVGAFKKVIDPADWDSYPFRAGDNTRRALDLFAEFDVKSTFFTLGWVAERDPGLIRAIVDAGHELACHGYGHQLVFDIGETVFREDVRRAKSMLEDIAGVAVRGYRAPSYSVTQRSLWAYDVLIDEGFTYSSSVFPIYHDVYGIPHSPRFPYIVEREKGSIREFPITTYPFRFLGRKLDLPFSGGGYFRLLPFPMIDRALRRINVGDGMPGMVYFHPWEIDPGQPRISGASLKSRFRHYVNLSRTWGKLQKLLGNHRFAPVKDVLAAMTLRKASTLENA
jgi:polysaccharide deacetylase family protein (PEP-CTERM system associated)